MGSIPYVSGGITGTTFRVWAPFATNVTVRGDFNGWGNTALVRDGTNGNWSVDVNGARPGHNYKYRVNGIDKRDPRARRVVNSTGNSIIYDPNAFNWGTTPKPAPFRNDLVIYQMHIGTFEGSTPPRTFDQGITRLDHVKNLGISAIKLMPVNEFPGGLSWGYNPTDQFAMESDYGSADGLKRFVKACHERGISVFMDVVHNHYGPTDMDMWQFDGWSQNGLGGIYFYNDNRAYTDWGSTRPDFGRAEVRSFIRDQIMMYVQEYRMGGFRWDSVYNILYYNNGIYNDQGFTLLRDINWELSQSYPEVVRGSEDHAFDQAMNYEYVWDVSWRWAAHGQLTQSSDANRSMAAVKGLYDGWASFNHVLFTEAHDYIGTLNGRTRLPSEIDSANPTNIWARKRALLGGAIVMTAPGIPMIFQGQEMHETQAFHDNTPLRWTLTNTYAGIVRAYRDLIHLRRNIYGGMNGLKGTGVRVNKTDEQNKVTTFIRWNAGGQVDDVFGVINFSATLWTSSNYIVTFPSTGTWYRHFNSDSTNYANDFGNVGDPVIEVGPTTNAAVNMGMYSLQLFSKTPAGNFMPVTPSVAFNPPAPTGCVQVAITYNAGTGPLMDAQQVFIHLGRNGWTNVIEPNPAMTSLGSNRWQYVHAISAGTYELNMVFNNGTNGVWDNNNNQDWAIPVVSCSALLNTNPVEIIFASAEQTVVSNVTSGLITIQLIDENSQAALSTNDATVALRSNLSGNFRNTSDSANITSVVISSGQSSASFLYRPLTLGTHTLTASNANLLVQTATQQLVAVAPPDPYDVRVFGNGYIIADGSLTPATSNFTAFGEVYVGTNFTRVFTVTNSGTSALGLGALQISGANSNDFAAVNSLPASLAVGQATNLTIRFTPSAAGVRAATISFTNSTAAKSPYNFAINGTGVAPVIALSTTSITVTTVAGNSPAAAAFSVTNSGTGIMAYTIATNQSWISVSPAGGSLNAGAGQSHNLNFSTAGLSAGSYSATVTVSAAFAANSPRRISVALTVNPPPAATQLVFTNTPRAIPAGDLSGLLTVALADAQGNYVASTNNRTILLSSDKLGSFRDATGSAAITSVVVSVGQSSADFRYTSSADGAHQLVASDASGALGSATQTLTVSSYIVDVFTNNTQFVVPDGVSQLVVEGWGGGGGARQASGSTTRRQGGGGGAYARSTLTVKAGNTFNVVVGRGGAAGSPAQNGGDSSFGNSTGTNLLAKGGGGAQDNNTPPQGGSATASISTDGVRYSGGAGGARSDSKSGGGGGGGGSAYSTTNGMAGAKGGTSTGGAGGNGTGVGGAGGAPNNRGQNGNAPGAGGGGAGNGSAISGAGADGLVKVSYTILRNGLVSVDPEFPQGCVPVTIIYEDNNGILAGAAAINVLIGHNNWMFTEALAMTRINSSTWTLTYQIPDGTEQLELVFNNAAGTWDSNGNQNWPIIVTGCSLSDPFVLVITNPPSDIVVSYTNEVISMQGEAARITGTLTWQNTLTGDAGVVPAGQNWELDAAALEVGPNLFRVSGATSTNNFNNGARDSATNATYNTDWATGMSGGTRWGGGWALTATANSGMFIATTGNNPNLLIGPRAWGLWANSGGLSQARRNFADRLHEGDVFSFRWQHNSVDAAGSAGFALRNFYNEALFEFYLSGASNTYYTIRDAAGERNSGIPRTDTAHSISFELVTPTSYLLTVDSAQATGDLIMASSEVVIRHFRFWNYTAGPGEAGNVYLNDLAVRGQPLEPEILTAQRTVNRRYGPTFTYLPQPDGRSVRLGFLTTEIGFIYEVVGKTNLMDPEWSLIGKSYFGNNEPLPVVVTNDAPNLFLRTRIRPVD